MCKDISTCFSTAMSRDTSNNTTAMFLLYSHSQLVFSQYSIFKILLELYV